MQKHHKFYFIKLFAPLSIVTLITITSICYIEVNNHIKNVINQVSLTIHNEEKIFKRDINDSVSNILFLKKIILSAFYDNKAISQKAITQITKTITSFSKHHNQYSIIRFINSHGQELIRISNRNEKVSIMPQNKLPKKQHRYYFTELTSLKNNEIYFSPLDLNIENKTIELPIRPMIRIGTPIFSKKGKQLGAIIINYNAQLLLEQLKHAERATPGDLFVINKNGYFILAKNPEHLWGNMLPSRKNITIQKMFPIFWKKMNAEHNPPIIYTKQGVFLITYITSTLPMLKLDDLKLKLIWFIPRNELIPSAIKYYLLILLLICAVIFFVSWIWSLLKVKQANNEQKLVLLATTDSLTKIANRHELFRTGELEFDRAKRFNNPFSVLLFDIDFFKKVNDTYGHLSGDKTLIKFAQIIKSNIRKIDTIGRLGGEEFVVIMPETRLNAAKIVAEKLRQQIMSIEIPFKETHFSITTSIGISAWNKQDTRFDSMINRADKNLYTAKEAGRNCIYP